MRRWQSQQSRVEYFLEDVDFPQGKFPHRLGMRVSGTVGDGIPMESRPGCWSGVVSKA